MSAGQDRVLELLAAQDVRVVGDLVIAATTALVAHGTGTSKQEAQTALEALEATGRVVRHRNRARYSEPGVVHQRAHDVWLTTAQRGEADHWLEVWRHQGEVTGQRFEADEDARATARLLVECLHQLRGWGPGDEDLLDELTRTIRAHRPADTTTTTPRRHP